jgi:hypothetical protein
MSKIKEMVQQQLQTFAMQGLAAAATGQEAGSAQVPEQSTNRRPVVSNGYFFS